MRRRILFDSLSFEYAMNCKESVNLRSPVENDIDLLFEFGIASTFCYLGCC